MEEMVVYAAHRLYMDGMTLAQVATKIDRSKSTVLYHFQKHGLVTRPRGGAIKESQAGPENGNWKGGRVTGKKGYVRIWMPEHHRADSIGYVYEHILVAEDMMGRLLLPEEVVHHKNNIKGDNRKVNLYVFSGQSDHATHHKGGAH